MIIGGELTKDKVVFTIDGDNSPKSIRGIFAGHSKFFTIPPYDERVDIKVYDPGDVVFTKTSGKDFSYEEFSGIVKKVTSFSKINTSDARGLVLTARDILYSDATMFFPSQKEAFIEVVFFYNWIRLDFFAPRFTEISHHVKRVLLELLGKEFKIFSNNIDDISIYNWTDECIFMSRANFDTIADVLVSYGLLAKVHKDMFVDVVTNFGIRRFSFLAARELYKKIAHIVPDAKTAEQFREMLEYITKIFSAIAKTGKVGDLDDHQFVVLDSFSPQAPGNSKYHKIKEIREMMTFLNTKLTSEMDATARKKRLTVDIDNN